MTGAGSGFVTTVAETVVVGTVYIEQDTAADAALVARGGIVECSLGKDGSGEGVLGGKKAERVSCAAGDEGRLHACSRGGVKPVGVRVSRDEVEECWQAGDKASADLCRR